MKKFLSVIIMLLVLSCTFVLLHTTIAQENNEMYVNAEEDTIARTENAQDTSRMGAVENVSALSKENTEAVPSTIAAGLTPEEGLTLTYNPSFLENREESFIVEKEGDSTYLYNPKSPLYPQLSNFTYIENENQLLVGVSNSDFIFLSVPYPLQQGEYIKDKSFEEMDLLVESTMETLDVKAGTFDNVAVFRYPDGAKVYFAKGIGIIKGADKDGETTIELVSVEED